MREGISLAAVIVGGVMIFGLAAWYQATIWNECRETNSFLYCVRLISK